MLTAVQARETATSSCGQRTAVAWDATVTLLSDRGGLLLAKRCVQVAWNALGLLQRCCTVQPWSVLLTSRCAGMTQVLQAVALCRLGPEQELWTSLMHS